jgi:hypothetical protein
MTRSPRTAKIVAAATWRNQPVHSAIGLRIATDTQTNSSHKLVINDGVDVKKFFRMCHSEIEMSSSWRLKHHYRRTIMTNWAQYGNVALRPLRRPCIPCRSPRFSAASHIKESTNVSRRYPAALDVQCRGARQPMLGSRFFGVFSLHAPCVLLRCFAAVADPLTESPRDSASARVKGIDVLWQLAPLLVGNFPPEYRDAWGFGVWMWSDQQ